MARSPNRETRSGQAISVAQRTTKFKPNFPNLHCPEQAIHVIRTPNPRTHPNAFHTLLRPSHPPASEPVGCEQAIHPCGSKTDCNQAIHATHNPDASELSTWLSLGRAGRQHAPAHSCSKVQAALSFAHAACTSNLVNGQTSYPSTHMAVIHVGRPFTSDPPALLPIACYDHAPSPAAAQLKAPVMLLTYRL